MGESTERKHTCPECGQHLSYEAAQGGLELACPNCGAAVLLPGEDWEPEGGEGGVQLIPPVAPTPRSIGLPYLRFMIPAFLALVVCLILLRSGERSAFDSADALPVVPSAGIPSSSPGGRIQSDGVQTITADEVTVRVIDGESGEGIRGRLRVFWSVNPSVEPEWVSTDGDGVGRFSVPNGTITLLRVYSYCNGYTPRMIHWNPGNEDALPLEYTFRLERGHSIGGRVIDEKGQPVAGARINFRAAVVLAGGQREASGFDGRRHGTMTDTEGKWHCEEAPRDLSNFRLKVEHDDFGEKWFRVVEIAAEEAGATAARVRREGHPLGEAEVSGADLQAGKAVLAITRLVTLTGIVVDGQGRPVPGGEVIRMESRQLLRLGLGRVLPWKEDANSLTQSAGDGRFTLRVGESTTALMAAHADAGFAIVPLEEFEAGGKLVIKPWGRLAGRLTIGGQPAANRVLVLVHQPMSDAAFVLDSRQFTLQTASDGGFAFERVPPGTLELFLSDPDQRSGGGSQRIARFEVASGESTRLDLAGAQVSGRIEAHSGVTAIDWSGSQCMLTPKTEASSSPARSSIPGSFVVRPGSDGRFEFALVQSGAYDLTVTLRGPSPARGRPGPVLATHQVAVVVEPPSAGDEAVDLGELQVQSVPSEPSE